MIIPVYNIEKYLEKCITSVLKQTEQDFEILLIDDGSTDRSGEICDSFAEKDNRIAVIHKKNGGLSSARNTGLSKAAGEFISFVDGDDYLSEYYLEKSLKAAKKYHADIVMFDYNFVDENGNNINSYHVDIEADKILTLDTCPELLNMTPSACNKLFNGEFLKKIKIEFPEGRLYEDLNAVSKSYYGASVVYIDAGPLYFYVNHVGSIMRMAVPDYKRRFEDRVLAVESVCEFYEKAGMAQQLRENLEFLSIYHIFFMLSIETIAENHKSSYLKEYKKYIQSHYPEYKRNKYIPLLLTPKEKIKFKLICGNHYYMVRLLGKMRRVIH